MTGWDTISMVQNNHTWTLTLNLEPGTYQWGAIEDDGSANGIWLIEGPNLEVTVSESGVVTGTVTYTTLITGIDEKFADLRYYPNPVKNTMYLELYQEASIRIMDMKGRVLLTKECKPGNEQLDLTGLKSGSYILGISNGSTNRYFSFIKE